MENYDECFNFNLCIDYLLDVDEYLNAEFGFVEAKNVNLYCKSKFYECNELTYNFKTGILGTYCNNDDSELYCTNKLFIKAVLLMIIDNNKYNILIKPVLFSFYNWASGFVGKYSTLKFIPKEINLHLNEYFLIWFFTPVSKDENYTTIYHIINQKKYYVRRV